MERSGLRPAPAPATARSASGSRAAAFTHGCALLAVALAATALGADAARRPTKAVARAAEIIDASLSPDPSAPADTTSLRAIRADLAARPLDARTRVLYAGLLLDRARSSGERTIATFQARRAAQLAPVTVPVVRAATVVLARAGAGEEALDQVRAMFAYDPGTAAELLSSIEPFFAEGASERAVADLPLAWLAWARRLARTGHAVESERWLERGLTRWPGEPGLLDEAAGRAAGRRDWGALDRLLPRSGLPEPTALSPRLLVLRAWGCAQRGDRDGARADVEEAVRRSAHDPLILSVAGDALAAAGDFDDAAARWNEAVYRLPKTRRKSDFRVSLLARIARLEDTRDRPGDALRAWRAVLRADPAHAEARARVVALGGSAPE